MSLVGRLKGPDDLLKFREEIQLSTSKGSVGDRKMELGTGFLRNCENCLDANGISFLILSAIETKYLLKESEMIVGSVVGVLSILTHIGGGVAEERREIRDLTPSQTSEFIRSPCK